VTIPKIFAQPFKHSAAFLRKFAVDRENGIPEQTVRWVEFTNPPTNEPKQYSTGIPFSWAWQSVGIGSGVTEDFEGYDNNTPLENSPSWAAGPNDQSDNTTAGAVFYNGYGWFARYSALDVEKVFAFPSQSDFEEDSTVTMDIDFQSDHTGLFTVIFTDYVLPTPGIAHYGWFSFSGNYIRYSVFGAGSNPVWQKDVGGMPHGVTYKVIFDEPAGNVTIKINDEQVYSGIYTQSAVNLKYISFLASGGGVQNLHINSIAASWLDNSTVSILYLREGEWIPHHTSVPNTGSYSGNLPSQAGQTKFRIRSDIYEWVYDDTANITMV